MPSRQSKRKKPRQPRRRKDSIDDDIEDAQMERNPMDYPFPQFISLESEMAQKKRIADCQIQNMQRSFAPVVEFQKPSINLKKPMWNGNTHLERYEVPAINLYKDPPKESISSDEASQASTARTSQLPWISSMTMKRVVSGAPSLGIPVKYSTEPLQESKAMSARFAEKDEKTRRLVEEGILVGDLKKNYSRIPASSRTTTRPTGQDLMGELLQHDDTMKQLEQEIKKSGRSRKTWLVSLPKVGVRLFMAPDTSQR